MYNNGYNTIVPLLKEKYGSIIFPERFHRYNESVKEEQSGLYSDTFGTTDHSVWFKHCVLCSNYDNIGSPKETDHFKVIKLKDKLYNSLATTYLIVPKEM